LNYDLINATFEFIGAILSLVNVRKLLRDKIVAGVNYWVQGYFVLWGGWNTIFYSGLDQWLSFSCGVLLAIINGVWFSLALRYSSFSDKKV